MCINNPIDVVKSRVQSGYQVRCRVRWLVPPTVRLRRWCGTVTERFVFDAQPCHA